jgi:hypothetical protein
MEIGKNASSAELKRLRQALDMAVAVARCNEDGHPQDFLHVRVDVLTNDSGLPAAVECARCGMNWPVDLARGGGQWTPVGDVEDAREAIAQCKGLVERNFASA